MVRLGLRKFDFSDKNLLEIYHEKYINIKYQFGSITLKILVILSFIFPILICAQTKQKSNDIPNFKRHYFIKKNVFESLPNDENEIIFLGNSITAGAPWFELFDDLRIKNRGISGDVTEGILYRLEEVTESFPYKIFLMIGVNDLSKDISVDSIIINYKSILKIITSTTPETKIYLQSVLPVNNEFQYFKNHTNKGNEILELNKKIKDLASEFNQTYIDLYSNFINEKGKLIKDYTFDGLHLNGAGYKIWKTSIEHCID